jgi:uncharacterized protein
MMSSPLARLIAAWWRPLCLLLTLAGMAALAGLGYGIYRQAVGTTSASVAEPAHNATQEAAPDNSIRLTISTEVIPPAVAIEQMEQAYEEALGSPLEEAIKELDHILVVGMQRFGGTERLRLREVILRQPEEDPERMGAYLFQHIVVDRDIPAGAFLDFLRGEITTLSLPTGLEPAGPASWDISILGHVTHQISFESPKTEPLAPDVAEAQGLLVIVIDDLGLDAAFARQLAALPLEITFSVLPGLPHSDDVVSIARKAGRELLLHQPMEPMGYPEVSPGEGALFGSMTGEQLRAIVLENLARVPAARGMNNHMGSRFTQDYRAVGAMLQGLPGNGFFVLDSLTHPRSVLGDLARKQGIPTLLRDVFLDVVRDADAVTHQLRKAESIALRKGRAVAIGHPFPETLEGIRRWNRERSPWVAVVSASALVPGAESGLARLPKSR